MDGITAIEGMTTHTGTAAGKEPITGVPGGGLGKNEFLSLLVSQMQSQDPLSPTDNTQMIAQLAQFSALEQMSNLNTTLGEFQKEMALLVGGLAGGKVVNAVLSDGTEVSGALGGVDISSGKLALKIGDGTYLAGNIVNMSMV